MSSTFLVQATLLAIATGKAPTLHMGPANGWSQQGGLLMRLPDGNGDAVAVAVLRLLPVLPLSPQPLCQVL